MAVLASVEAALAGLAVPAWQSDLALSLAASMDDRPSASTAKELRSLLEVILGDSVPEAADRSDDLAAKRAARRSASG